MSAARYVVTVTMWGTDDHPSAAHGPYRSFEEALRQSERLDRFTGMTYRDGEPHSMVVPLHSGPIRLADYKDD